MGRGTGQLPGLVNGPSDTRPVRCQPYWSVMGCNMGLIQWAGLQRCGTNRQDRPTTLCLTFFVQHY